MSNNIVFVKGDDSTFKITLTKADGTAYSLVGCTLVLYVKTKRTDSDANALITKTSAQAAQINIPVPADGIAYVYFVPADTSSSPDLTVDQEYDYDIELTTVGVLKFTIIRAHFTVLQD